MFNPLASGSFMGVGLGVSVLESLSDSLTITQRVLWVGQVSGLS